MNIKAESIKSRWEWIALGLILALGIFLRTWHFSSWLEFEIDQTYDTILVSQGVENGPSHLPLLGPTAGGGRSLRLGPAFYYLEYLSAQIFGDNPAGHAMLVLLTSIASLPLFYLFIRRYFSKTISLTLLFLYSVSLYTVMYSRFSWSPNVLPFFLLLTFYSLLCSLSENEKHRDGWFLLAAFSGAILTQIHFNAFFTVLPIIFVLLVAKRPRFKFKTWLAAAGIVLAVYSPMLISDLKTGGENMQLFFEKSTSNTMANFHYKRLVLQDLRANALESTLMISGVDLINAKPGNRTDSLDFFLKNGILGNAIIFIYILTLGFFVARIKREKDPDRRTFLLLVFLWLSISFFYFFMLLRGGRVLYPRFFLISTVPPFFLLGLILSLIAGHKNRLRLGFVIALTIILGFFNLFQIGKVFLSRQAGQKSPQELATEDVFPDTNRLTLFQEQEAAEYIYSVYEKNHYPVYIQALHEYEPAFWYHLAKFGVDYWAPMPSDHPYREGNYFNIYFTEEKKNPGHAYTLKDRKVFGSITVDHWTPKNEYIVEERQNEATRQETDQMKHIGALYTWEDLIKNTPPKIQPAENSETSEGSM